MAKNGDKNGQKFLDSADKVKDLSDELAKMAQKIANSDDKTKQKLIDQYQKKLETLMDLQKQQNNIIKLIVQNAGS